MFLIINELSFIPLTLVHFIHLWARRGKFLLQELTTEGTQCLHRVVSKTSELTSVEKIPCLNYQIFNSSNVVKMILIIFSQN